MMNAMVREARNAMALPARTGKAIAVTRSNYDARG